MVQNERASTASRIVCPSAMLALLRRQVNELHHKAIDGRDWPEMRHGGKYRNRPEAGGPPARHKRHPADVRAAPPSRRRASSRFTTAPAPEDVTTVTINIVQFAPSVAPCSTTVVRYSSLRLTAERGLYTLVKTMLGPQKTSSSRVTLSYTDTLF